MEKVNGITEFLKECRKDTISFLLANSSILDKNRFVFEENGLEKPFVLVDVDDICDVMVNSIFRWKRRIEIECRNVRW